MAIQVTCECGKRLILKDIAAGKRLKCPGCRSVIQVPTRSNAAAQDVYQLAEEPASEQQSSSPIPVGFHDLDSSGLQDRGKPKPSKAKVVWLAISVLLCTTVIVLGFMGLRPQSVVSKLRFASHSNLLGIWKRETEKKVYFLEFRADGVYSYKWTSKAELAETEFRYTWARGQWKLVEQSGDQITIKMPDLLGSGVQPTFGGVKPPPLDFADPLVVQMVGKDELIVPQSELLIGLKYHLDKPGSVTQSMFGGVANIENVELSGNYRRVDRDFGSQVAEELLSTWTAIERKFLLRERNDCRSTLNAIGHSADFGRSKIAEREKEEKEKHAREKEARPVGQLVEDVRKENRDEWREAVDVLERRGAAAKEAVSELITILQDEIGPSRNTPLGLNESKAPERKPGHARNKSHDVVHLLRMIGLDDQAVPGLVRCLEKAAVAPNAYTEVLILDILPEAGPGAAEASPVLLRRLRELGEQLQDSTPASDYRTDDRIRLFDAYANCLVRIGCDREQHAAILLDILRRSKTRTADYQRARFWMDRLGTEN